MQNYLLEPFLSQYYLLEGICGPFLSEAEKKTVYFDLARIYCLTDGKELTEYFRLSRQTPFREVRDLASYRRLCRTVEYAAQTGAPVELTLRERTVLARKQEAMTRKDEIFRDGRHLTREFIASNLLSVASLGSIEAMALLAYLEQRGICLPRDPHSAQKRLRHCARWNHLFGNLMGIAFDEDRRGDYYNNLYTVLRSEGQRLAFEDICRATGYTGPFEKVPEARILHRAFSQGGADPDHYSQPFAKVLFSRLISSRDKEKLLLDKPKDSATALSDLPFDAEQGEFFFDPTCAEGLPLCREAETRQILRNVSLLGDCGPQVSAPLMVVSPDPYLSEMYRAMLLRGLGGTAVIELDAGTLTRDDFFGGRENIFLRGLTETRSLSTVYLIRDCEELDVDLADELCKVLDPVYRKNFKLFQPPVTFDLSGLSFLLLASERTEAVDRLCQVCDTLRTERIRPEEKKAVAQSIFRDRAASFRRSDAVLEEGCAEYLAAFDTRQIRQILDGALREAVFARSDRVTLEGLKAVCKANHVTETRRQFGYKGGSCDA